MGKLVSFLHQDPENFVHIVPQESPCKCTHMLVVGFDLFYCLSTNVIMTQSSIMVGQ